MTPKEKAKQIKCYCGHTTYCDCGPLENKKPLNQNNMKQTAVEWLVEQYKKVGGISISMSKQAKEMEKEQIKDSFVECWKANVPEGVECKLDAQQYYTETFKSEQDESNT